MRTGFVEAPVIRATDEESGRWSPSLMDERLDALLDFLGPQEGLFTWSQGSRAGFTDSSLSRLISRNDWKEVLPGVYATRPGRVVGQQRIRAAQLWAGHRGAIARRTTARLYGLDGSWGDQVEIIAEGKTRAPAPWVTLVYSHLEAADRTTHKGIRTMTVSRALLDLGAVIDEDELELALESALRLGLTTCGYLEKRLTVVGGKGRRGVAALRRVLAARGPGTKATESYLETQLVQMLRVHRVYPPERQYTIRDGHREVARVDLAWPSLKLPWRPTATAGMRDGWRGSGT